MSVERSWHTPAQTVDHPRAVTQGSDSMESFRRSLKSSSILPVPRTTQHSGSSAIETGSPVSIADDPLCCVVLGTGKMLDDFKLLRKLSIESEPWVTARG